MQERPVTSQLKLDDVRHKDIYVNVYEMSGYNPEDENSLEAPRLVEPKQKESIMWGNVLTYVFPRQSITVFRFYKAAN
jgi:hypothetical protein